MSATSNTHHHPAGEHHPRDGQEFTEQLEHENAVLGHGHHSKTEQDAEQAEAAERRAAIQREVAEKAHDSALHPSDRQHEHEHVHQAHK